MRHYVRGTWILMRLLVGLEDGICLYGDRCISEIPRPGGGGYLGVIKYEVQEITLSTSDLTSGEHLGVNWGFLITILPKQPVRCITNRLIMRTVKCLCVQDIPCVEKWCVTCISALALWHWHDFELLQLITWSYEGDSSYLRSIYTERKQMWCHSHKGS